MMMLSFEDEMWEMWPFLYGVPACTGDGLAPPKYDARTPTPPRAEDLREICRPFDPSKLEFSAQAADLQVFSEVQEYDTPNDARS